MNRVPVRVLPDYHIDFEGKRYCPGDMLALPANEARFHIAMKRVEATGDVLATDPPPRRRGRPPKYERRDLQARDA